MFWGPPRRGWRIGKGPKATRYLSRPRFIYHGKRLYLHYRSGNFVLHRDYIG